MIHSKISGLIAAPYTAFDQKAELNLDLIPAYASYLKHQGVMGVFVAGTTGEGMLMNLEERKALLTAWMRHQSPDFKILCHAGSTSYKDSQDLAAHAQSIGADAISVMGPLFLKPNSINDLINYCSEVTSAADKTPFYYYHIPSVSGVNLSMNAFLNAAIDRLPTLVGIKFTDGNLMELNQCLHAHNGKWDILHGQDETLLAGLTLGVQGGVGSTYNYMAPLYNLIINYFESGDIPTAREYQYKSVAFIKDLIHFGGGVIGGKPLMKLVGLDCGPLRAPAHNISESEFLEFSRRIKESGIDKYFLSKG